VGRKRSGAAWVFPASVVCMDGRDKPGHGEVGESVNAVYIMTSGRHGTLYVGVTSDLALRVGQHRDGIMDGFTKRYGVKRLVWFERHDSIVPAIARETALKKYKREWKINLIETNNPDCDDLFPALVREHGPLAHLQPPELHM
jgi:putative endonuclease